MISLLDDPAQIDWAAAAEFFRLAPLGTREPEKLGRVFLNSYACAFAFEGHQRVVLCRSDDGCSSS